MAERNKSGFATAALVLGIMGICLSFIPLINSLSFILGVVAIILSLISLFKKASIIKAIISLILAVISVVSTIIMQVKLINTATDALDGFTDELSTIIGDNTQDVIEKYIAITIGDFTVTENSDISQAKLDVNIKNKSNEKRSFTVTIDAVDKSGELIQTDYIFANNILAGAGQSFELFTAADDDIIDKLKGASFYVAEALAF